MCLIGAQLAWHARAHGQAGANTSAVEHETLAARQSVERAEALFSAENYEAALAEFTAAYRQLEGDPRQRVVLYNIAVCHERLFHYAAALTFYERYAREGQISDAERAEVTALVEALRGLLGTLNIRSNVPAEVWVDGRLAGRSPARVMVAAGRHLIELQANQYESTRREVIAPARTVQALAFELAAVSGYRGLPPAYMWIAGGLSVVAFSTGAVLGVQAQNEDARARAHLDFVRDGDAEAVRGKQLAANIAFATGAGLAITTVVLALLTRFSNDEASARQPVSAWSVNASPNGTLVLHTRGSLP